MRASSLLFTASHRSFLHRSFAHTGLALALTVGMLTAPAAVSAGDGGLEHIAIERVEVYPDPGKLGSGKRIVVSPHRPVDVEIWTNKGHGAKYCVGEEIEIYFRTNRDAYVAIYNTDTRGRTHRLFPNRYDHDNFVRGGKTYRLPARGYDFYIEGPRGRESLKAVAALHKRDLRLGRHLPASYDDRYDSRDWRRERYLDDPKSSTRVSFEATLVDHDEDDRYDRRYEDDRRYDKYGDDEYYRDGHSGKSVKIGVERIVTVPDDDYDTIAVDTISHRVRDGRSCHLRRPHPRPWWK